MFYVCFINYFMAKKIYETTSIDANERYKQRNRQAAAASRKKKDDAFKASQEKNVALKATISLLRKNIALCKEKIICTDTLLKENRKLKQQLRGTKRQLHVKNAEIKELSFMILEL